MFTKYAQNQKPYNRDKKYPWWQSEHLLTTLHYTVTVSLRDDLLLRSQTRRLILLPCRLICWAENVHFNIITPASWIQSKFPMYLYGTPFNLRLNLKIEGHRSCFYSVFYVLTFLPRCGPLVRVRWTTSCKQNGQTSSRLVSVSRNGSASWTLVYTSEGENEVYFRCVSFCTSQTKIAKSYDNI